MKRRLIFSAVVTLLLVGAVTAMEVKSDYDTDYNFAKLKKFFVKGQGRRGNDPLATSTLVLDRIYKALEAGLSAQGYVKTDKAEADFLVNFFTTTRDRIAVEDLSWGYPYRWRWGWGPNVWVRQYTQGALVVDFVDLQTKKLVWRGIARDTLQPGGPEKSEKMVKKAVEELMKRFQKDMKKK